MGKNVAACGCALHKCILFSMDRNDASGIISTFFVARMREAKRVVKLLGITMMFVRHVGICVRRKVNTCEQKKHIKGIKIHTIWLS